ncbi:MAG TPA: LLM class flavin-dependent oxidoreductase [Acidimicrobiales bacterium]|nr:LLM class flavin-dependent oxidoreductase [Acidimicrobiales bacterium]
MPTPTGKLSSPARTNGANAQGDKPMPIDIRARLVSAPRRAGYSCSLLATQANYYGDSLAHRGADAEWLAQSALQYEALGYDSALIPQRSGWPDVWALTAWALATTKRFAIAAAHRVGLQNPTAAARSIATLHELSGGRVSAHVILGTTDADQQRDGDFLDKSTRYRRAAEYFQVVRLWLESENPFDFDGEFYRIKDALAGHHPGSFVLSYGGSSNESLDLAGRYADVYAVTAEPLAGTSELMGRVREIAASFGRQVSFWFSGPNFILGETDAAARRKAAEITAELLVARDYQERRNIGLAHGINEQAESVNRQRFLRNVYDAGDWHDKAMYTGIGRITGYGWPAFVGSPETVADALLDYYDLGVRVFGIGMSIDAEEDQELAQDLFQRLRAGAEGRDNDLPATRRRSSGFHEKLGS